MSELKLERRFKATPAKVFAFVSEPGNILKWWGPERMTVPEARLDFSRPGPWSSVMVNAEGQRYKVTGEVIAVDPPRSVEFTWGWHDGDDKRGHESRVRFTVEPAAGGGTLFTLHHTGLADAESANSHQNGWESSLRKLTLLDA